MKRLNTILKITAAAVFACSLLASCAEEGPTVAKAVLGDVSHMTFAAENPAAQTVTVYSDGDWHTTAPSWITVDPATGNGTTIVTVSASENIDAGGMLEPRKDTLIIGGNTLASRLIIIVSQEGDAYRNAEHLTLDKVAALADGKSFILDEANVVALTSAGFVLNTGTTNVYAQSVQEVKIGDKVSIKGIKGRVNSLPAITQVDELKVLSSGDYTYPEAIVLNDVIASYKADAIEYVTVSGVVSGGNLTLTIDDVDYSIRQVDAPADLKLSSLNGHKATVTGYSCGILGDRLFGIFITELKDNGLDQLIYFEDDFEWFTPWTDGNASIPDDVAANSVGSSPNIFTTAALKDLLTEFQSRGYGYIWGWKEQEWSDGTPDNGNKQTMYLQKNYLKFGKTSYNSGIILPALAKINDTDDIDLNFDWCWCMTGASKPDIMTLTITVSGGGVFENGTEISDEITSSQPTEDDLTKLEWQHAQVRIKGATPTTKVTIRPTNNDPSISSTRKQNRWYLDNIKVLPAEGSTPGGGDDPNEVKLPVEWSIQTDANNFNETWPLANGSATEEGVSGYIASVTGTGTIWYNNEAGNAADLASGKKKTKLDIQALNPRVTGAWPGDYCQFKVPGVVSKGKKVRITFETRTSATNPKYWKLIYLDGNEWKAAAEIKTDKVEGTDVEYTHAMNADGATNVKVDATVTYSVKTENVVFRFVCQSAMGAGGDMLTAPNGGTWRLAVTDISTTEWQPRIQWGE